ncbi:MAG: lipopolysaccharide heptosyltransferase II [Pseudomonadota bacterium]
MSNPLLATSSVYRILIISPNWVGDAAMASVVVQGLIKKYAKADQCNVQIDILTPITCEAVWQHIAGIHQVFVHGLKHSKLYVREILEWGRRFRGCYDHAVILPNSFKSALIPWLANIPLRTGYVGEFRYGLLNDWHHLDKEKLPKWVDRCYALVSSKQIEGVSIEKNIEQPLVAPRLIANHAIQKMLIEKFFLTDALSNGHFIVAICPGAEFGSAKQWPLHHWQTLARSFIKKQYTVWVMGGPKEVEIGNTLVETVPGVLSFCGLTTLGEAIDLLAFAHLVVANDSGLLHIAAALGRATIGLYGSTPSEYAPPIARWEGQTKVMEVNLECRPCKQRECPLGHKKCLELIEPSQVEWVGMRMLERVSNH